MKLQAPLLLVALASSTPCLAQEDAPGIVGRWRGDMAIPGGSLEIAFVVEPTSDGWEGTVDTPGQGIYGLPITVARGDGEDAFVIEVPSTAATFEAELSDEGDELVGEWSQRGATLELSCAREAPQPPIPTALRARLEGTWEGILDAGAIELRIVLALSTTEGRLLGHMVSPDQGPDEIPITRIDHLDEGKLRVCVGSLFTTFTVELDEEAAELEGTFRQGRGSFPISLSQVDAPSVVRRPQEPKPPFPYRVEEVVYKNDAAGVTLAGTLTLPEGEGPFPAALLITGSGSQDRDETIFQHKPFLVIADHLTRRGVAVLRVDDRGVGGSTAGADPAAVTSQDYVGDVRAGVTFLSGREEIAGDKIGLIGHSEGGVVAPLVATRCEDVAFIVLLAGTGIRGDRLLMLQNELISRAEGLTGEELESALALNRALFDLVLDEELSSFERALKMREVIDRSPTLSEASEEEREGVLAQVMTPWVQWFLRHDPATVLEAVRCPVLALNGSLDIQVPSEVNLEAIKAALTRGKNSDFEVRAFEGLNHLFQHCETGEVKEYGEIEETCSPEVLEVLSSWISERFLSER